MGLELGLNLRRISEIPTKTHCHILVTVTVPGGQARSSPQLSLHELLGKGALTLQTASTGVLSA